MSTSEQMTAIKKYISRMPSLPTSVTKILEICNNPTTSPADLNKVISLDPVLMGKVLKLINSAYYGLSKEVTSLVRAIIMLGINTVKNLALSTAVLGTLGKKENFQALNMNGFWRHSLCVGVTAKRIAQNRGVHQKQLEGYFIAGLLHDVGKIPLNNVLMEEYIVTMSISDRENLPLQAAEKQTLGIDHTEIGTMIVETWKLGQEMQDVISLHHSPHRYEGEYQDLVNTVYIANYFANLYEIGFSGDRCRGKADQSIFEDLAVSMDDLEDMEEEIHDSIEKASIFLKLSS